MDSARDRIPASVPRRAEAAVEERDDALAEIDAAIALVAGHVARRVRLIALPFVVTVAAIGSRPRPGRGRRRSGSSAGDGRRRAVSVGSLA